MNRINWDEIEEAQGFSSPTPGGYIAVITHVEDVEEKEYLKIEWDFAEGKYKGENRETFERAGFWPITLYKSYKASALPFFKSFKTALEASNRAYTFDEGDLRSMVGKVFGVVLGEEGYIKKTGEVGKRLYVAQTHSTAAIQKGEFKIPEFREARQKDGPRIYTGGGLASADNSKSQFADLNDDDDKLPF